MPFLTSARDRASSLPTGSREKIILDYLLSNAIGRANAKPWKLISAHLATHGISIAQQTFQQGLLKESRENDIFIASTDHGRSKGYYLIEEPDDATLMKDWYENRISAEQARLENLMRIARSKGWTI